MAIRISMGHVDTYNARTAAFARQLSLRSVQMHAPSNLPADAGYRRTEDLRALRERCEKGGQAAVHEVISRLGSAGRIWYVHFRDVRGQVPAFTECFLGEGNLDPPAVIRRLMAVGFVGFLIDDHVPAMVGDPSTWADSSSDAYCSRGRAHAIGYLQGVLDALGVA